MHERDSRLLPDNVQFAYDRTGGRRLNDFVDSAGVTARLRSIGRLAGNYLSFVDVIWPGRFFRRPAGGDKPPVHFYEP
jgi:hypothetical protein